MNSRSRQIVTLAALRDAIRRGAQARFFYEGVTMTADLYLLGTARKTEAYIVLAWVSEPALGWQRIRYAAIRDFELIGYHDCKREGYNPSDPQIMLVDTLVPRVAPRPPYG